MSLPSTGALQPSKKAGAGGSHAYVVRFYLVDAGGGETLAAEGEDQGDAHYLYTNQPGFPFLYCHNKQVGGRAGGWAGGRHGQLRQRDMEGLWHGFGWADGWRASGSSRWWFHWIAATPARAGVAAS